MSTGFTPSPLSSPLYPLTVADSLILQTALTSIPQTFDNLASEQDPKSFLAKI